MVRYTEADIARLEREDLTDLTVMSKLDTAYRQNDPNEEEFFPGLRRDPIHFMNAPMKTSSAESPRRRQNSSRTRPTT